MGASIAASHVPVMSIYVSDMEAARRFYVEVVGFAEKARYGEDIMTLSNSGSMIVIEKVREGEVPRVVPGLQVADIAKAFAACKASGVTLIDQAPRPFPAGMVFSIKDPSGNELDVLEFKR
jgi:predicted enzyme related to lactoylglutathione lyase